MSVVEALEIFNIDVYSTNYLRAYAWFRLVKLWTGMCFNDTQGVTSSTLKMEEQGLHREIHRSKTFGAGKRVGILGIYVNKQAWIKDGAWLETGWKIWTELGSAAGLEGRAFMLPTPTPDAAGFARKMASYATASALF